MTKYRTSLLLIFVLMAQVNICLAQLEIRPIGKFHNNTESKNNSRIKAYRDTVSLPFWDDFSSSDQLLDTMLWESNTGAMINNSLGKWAPTVNVLTFDGLDLSGSPQNPNGVNSEAVDVVTSQPIDLESVTLDKRDSVWFSFYWMMKGLGEIPEQKDTLKVLFLDEKGEWHQVFEKLGTAENFKDSFQKDSIKIDNDSFFHAGFQFQFKASGNSLGPYDQWHIDYVYLNQDRSPGNESLADRAATGPPTSIFSEYSMIPYDVLFDFPDTIYQKILFDFATLRNSNANVQFKYKLTNYDYPNTDSARIQSVLLDTIVLDGTKALPARGRNENELAPLKHSYFMGFDSLFIETELVYHSTGDGYFIKSIDGPDDAEVITYLEDENYNYRLNDTVRSYFEIHETLAYDDGSAEYAAGLNKNESQFAVQFELPSQDTLTAIDIHFPQFSRESSNAVSPSGERIILSVMKDTTDAPSSILRSQEFIVPGGAKTNQFDRFVFDFPIVVSGEFYIALQQLTNEYIGIGLDNNSTLGTRKIFVKVEDEWELNNKVEGILMFRPVFEDNDYIVTEIPTLIDEISVFPNPANSILNIQGIFNHYTLVNLSGSVVSFGSERHININHLQSGIYVLKVFSKDNIYTKKIVIRH